MCGAKVVEKIETHILYSITFFRKSWRLWDNVEKYGRARQATDDNIIRRMRIACLITKATDTISGYVILLFHGNSGYTSAPECYVTRTLRVVLTATSFTNLFPEDIVIPSRKLVWRTGVHHIAEFPYTATWIYWYLKSREPGDQLGQRHVWQGHVKCRQDVMLCSLVDGYYLQWGYMIRTRLIWLRTCRVGRLPWTL
jgi:hypothetical protein